MFSGFLRKRVFFRVIALFVAVLIFVSVLIASFSVLYFRQTTHEIIALVRAQSIRAIELTVNNKLSEYANLLYQVVIDTEVRTILYGLRDDTYENPSLGIHQLKSRLIHYSGLSSDILAITIIDAQNRMISYDRTSQLSHDNHGLLVEDYDSGRLAELIEPANTKKKITFIADDRHPDDLSMIHIVFPVWDYYSREELGTALLTIDAATLWKLIGSESVDGLVELFLLQDDGRLLVHPNYSMTGQYLSGYYLLPDEMEIAPVELEQDDDPIIPRGAELIVSPLERYDLYLVSMMDPAMYNETTVRYSGYVLTITLVTLLGSTALCFIVLKGLLRSIKEIIREIAKVKDGNLSTRIRIEPRDEIYDIADALNDMLENLQQVSNQRDQEFLRYLQESERRRIAESKTLESQINSHFLYNTLNTISYSAIEDGSIRTSEMIHTLSDCLRYTLDKRHEVVTVQDEMRWIKRYLELQKERQPSLFSYNIKIGKGCEGLSIHKMLMQPFIENSILHGFAGYKKGGIILIRARRLNNPDRIVLTIYDNGVGLSPEKLEQIQSVVKDYEAADGLGIGIENVCFRLKTHYKGSARIHIRSIPQMGTHVNLVLPAISSQRIDDSKGFEWLINSKEAWNDFVD